MTFAGHTHDFLGDMLPQDMRPEIFKLVHQGWKKVKNPRQARLEPRITALLQRAMIEQQEKQFKDPPFYIPEDVKKRDPKSGKEIQRSDLEVHLRAAWIKGQKPYFVFEAKRLNISYGPTVDSNAHEYISDAGMGCLLAGSYDAVPNYSGMLGFVMDGKIAAAKKSIERLLNSKSQQLLIDGRPKVHRSSLMPKSSGYGETRHRSGTKAHSVFHMFLAVGK